MSQKPTSPRAVPPRIPLRDFFRNPERSGYKISPDGQYVSHMEPHERRMNIVVRTRAEAASDAPGKRITDETERDIGGYWWKNPERIVYIKDFGGDENYHLFSVSKDGSNLIDLTPFEGVKVEVIDDLEDFPNEILIGMNKRDPEIFDVYRLNIETGEMRMVAENPGNITGWMADHSGAIRAAVATDGVNNTLMFRANESDQFAEACTTHFKESLDPLFFTFDNKYLYVSTNIGRDRSAIVKYDPATNTELEVLFEHPEVDVEGMAYSRKRKVLTAISYTTWKQQRHFLDEETRRIFDRLSELQPGREIGITDMTKDEQTLILRAYNDRTLGTYYIYEIATDTLTKLSEMSPWLKEEHLAEMKPITYMSRDGLVIHGYLTLPVGVEPKGLPVVVNPHGGPWVRDKWTYNPEVQFLANRGYAVLQINYRGSTGYGRKFWESSFKQWGRAMQDDVSDGVEWLITEGIADAKRVAIYGGSYGGYCTLAGLTFSPDLYACGIDYVGVSNLLTFLGTIPPYWKPYLESMYEMVGNPETERAMLEAASPVFHVDKIKAPLMVIQGAKDPRVNINESNQIVEALKQRGLDVPYIVKENEGHGFRNEENRFEVYEAMESFLEKHLN